MAIHSTSTRGGRRPRQSRSRRSAATQEYTLYFGTNRNAVGGRPLSPKGFGEGFRADGCQNMRFGELSVKADPQHIATLLAKKADGRPGDGEGLTDAFAGAVKDSIAIALYPENTEPDGSAKARRGSRQLFSNLEEEWRKGNQDALVFIHGYNVSWEDAVSSALALQEMLNMGADGSPASGRALRVVLFSWPSDGSMMPFTAYKSDRSDARESGKAVGRGFLKLRDFLRQLWVEQQEQCDQRIHLVCHSMGNYVLQNALQRLEAYSEGGKLPRLFRHVFLCAADVDDTVFENGAPMSKIHQTCHGVTVYHNEQDVALTISDLTKGHPDRLGHRGAARPTLTHHRIHQVDCTTVVHRGFTEHSYYLTGRTNEDIRMTVRDLPFDDASRSRKRHERFENVWKFG